MVPLSEYAVVPETATVMQALRALDSAQHRLPAGRAPHRAVLVVNRRGEVVGKVGQWSFLRSLEPKYGHVSDIDRLTRAGVSDSFIASMMENFRLFQDDVVSLCRGARDRRITDVMRPVTEYINADASLPEAIHMLVVKRTLSLLVRDGSGFVGLLRLADVFSEMSDRMKECADSEPANNEE